MVVIIIVIIVVTHFGRFNFKQALGIHLEDEGCRKALTYFVFLFVLRDQVSGRFEAKNW